MSLNRLDSLCRESQKLGKELERGFEQRGKVTAPVCPAVPWAAAVRSSSGGYVWAGTLVLPPPADEQQCPKR
jgi:hypothetical protein